ncbi:MAG: sulfatase-like hydrolase/transferase, partial [Chitinophagales bacterium]|nr:sulfatase-like hydrolase/transferase [Chitinophagales bacterium]
MSKLLTLLTFTCVCFSLNAQTSEKPNIVFIIMDDLNDYVQGFDGHPQAKTPNIAKIEKKGTTFVNSYCAAPKCGPSRTSMITGKDCNYTQIYNNGDLKCGNFRNNFTAEKGNETIYT